MRNMMLSAAAFAFLALAAPTLAAPCKDPKTGKFIKCPEKAATKTVRCKGANGKFAKCGTPGAKPM